ncbi:RDD family protein [Streptomyces cavernae]|uniref:RDD family protein n=1 Tax=Streptomyces cavernae TaxID=2259034 RepID=UPI000FEB6707|nr:RDD family protein [Streptomyces cavernae]
MSELVTGEAVALELRPAKLPSRGLAVLIDLGVAIAAYVAVTLGLAASVASLDTAAQTAVSIAAFILLLVGVPIAVETLSHGRSLGKLACGLRVVRDDGGPIRFRHALVRGAVGVVEILMTGGVVACIASLASARGRRVGDVFAGTLVVRERVPAGRAGFVPPPPPWLAGRFAGLDLSAVPDGLWLAIRQYLTRMQQLDPQVGWTMAERLATDLAERTGAPVPPGVPPAAFLAAVVHERQAREARRTFGGAATGNGGPTPAFQPGAPSIPTSPTGASPSTTSWPAPVAGRPGPPAQTPAQQPVGVHVEAESAQATRWAPPAPQDQTPRTQAPPAHAPQDQTPRTQAPPAQQTPSAQSSGDRQDERPTTGFVPPA